MLSEIKLTITHKGELVGSVSKEISKYGLVKSIEDFQIIANAAMTKLIEDAGESGPCPLEEDSEESENEHENVCVSPKKKRI